LRIQRRRHSAGRARIPEPGGGRRRDGAVQRQRDFQCTAAQALARTAKLWLSRARVDERLRRIDLSQPGLWAECQAVAMTNITLQIICDEHAALAAVL